MVWIPNLTKGFDSKSDAAAVVTKLDEDEGPCDDPSSSSNLTITAASSTYSGVGTVTTSPEFKGDECCILLHMLYDSMTKDEPWQDK